MPVTRNGPCVPSGALSAEVRDPRSWRQRPPWLRLRQRQRQLQQPAPSQHAAVRLPPYASVLSQPLTASLPTPHPSSHHCKPYLTFPPARNHPTHHRPSLSLSSPSPLYTPSTRPTPPHALSPSPHLAPCKVPPLPHRPCSYRTVIA